MADKQFDCLLQHSRKFFIEDKIINYIDETGDYMETTFSFRKILLSRQNSWKMK